MRIHLPPNPRQNHLFTSFTLSFPSLSPSSLPSSTKPRPPKPCSTLKRISPSKPFSTTRKSSPSKSLSPKLKELINAQYADSGVRPKPEGLSRIFRRMGRDAARKGVRRREWIAVAAATTVTMNSPASLTALWNAIPPFSEHSARRTHETLNRDQISPSNTSDQGFEQKEAGSSSRFLGQRRRLYEAELIREVALKSISFNGIPKAINTLTAFTSDLPEWLKEKQGSLREWRTEPFMMELAVAEDQILESKHGTSSGKENSEEIHRSRSDNEIAKQSVGTQNQRNQSLERIREQGLDLWTSVYGLKSSPLIQKLAKAHPDLPGTIITAHYGLSLSYPPSSFSISSSTRSSALLRNITIDRWLTSLVAMSCLRAQGGAGPQVISHIFGLRNALLDSSSLQQSSNGEQMESDRTKEQNRKMWLASDQGNIWILNWVDEIVSSFYPLRDRRVGVMTVGSLGSGDIVEKQEEEGSEGVVEEVEDDDWEFDIDDGEGGDRGPLQSSATIKAKL